MTPVQTILYVSLSIFSLLDQHKDFNFTPRPKEHLPASYPEDLSGTCYFLDSYKHSKEDKLKYDIIAAIIDNNLCYKGVLELKLLNVAENGSDV